MRAASLAAFVCAPLLAGCPGGDKATEAIEEPALPREPVLEVNVQFASLSNEGTQVDPALISLKAHLEQQAPRFSSYQLLSAARVELPMSKTVSVPAPRASPAVAQLTLKTLGGGKAEVDVEVADVHTLYRLGDPEPVVIHYGSGDDGEQVLLISPVPARPRAAPPRAPSERRRRPDQRR